ncbi:MAG: hypothetical protein FRX49_06317 [Trebouxia sp. A1-2]|nr:MAG: hypothetical protein FRX49_06317 [Trebouxia sp. A1-2]
MQPAGAGEGAGAGARDRDTGAPEIRERGSGAEAVQCRWRIAQSILNNQCSARAAPTANSTQNTPSMFTI